MNQNERYDAIVVGVGISGGWAANHAAEQFKAGKFSETKLKML